MESIVTLVFWCDTCWIEPTSLDVFVILAVITNMMMIIKLMLSGDGAAVPNRVQHSRQDRDGSGRPQEGLPLLAGLALSLSLGKTPTNKNGGR